MTLTCDLCSADLPPDESCRQRFNRLLALEYGTSATYKTVHHLTVPCYMLQHNEYSRDAWLAAHKMLAIFVRGVTPDSIGRNCHLQSRNRTWSITRGPKLAEFIACDRLFFGKR